MDATSVAAMPEAAPAAVADMPAPATMEPVADMQAADTGEVPDAPESMDATSVAAMPEAAPAAVADMPDPATVEPAADMQAADTGEVPDAPEFMDAPTGVAMPEAAPAAVADMPAPATVEPAADMQAADFSGVPDVPEAAAVDTGVAVPEAALVPPMPEPAVTPGVATPETAVLPETDIVAEPETVVPEVDSDTEVPAADTPLTDTVTTPTAGDTAPAGTTVTTAIPPGSLGAPVSEQPAQQLAEPLTPAAAAQSELAAPSEPLVPAPASKAPAEGNTYRILAEAREAYWLRDYETAESLYRQLTTMEPDNPDGYGELGNMYFSQGMCSAYFEAGTRLAKEGQLEQARQLVDVIRGLDGTQAEELNKRIAAAQADTH
jgi:hypothetical protein